MAKNIERVNYYEREYLRSFDFEAEQRYHMEMRRRLNLALHRWGIVDGLKLEQYKELNVERVRISPGMAIDAYGREIILRGTHTLDEDDLKSNNIVIPVKERDFSIWIAYERSQERPPEEGYKPCDIADQYTRWRESPRILIREADQPAPTPEPDILGDLSDDPQKDPWPIFLGHIHFAPGIPPAFTFVNTSLSQRQYIGLRAQEVIAPHNHPLPYDVLKDNGPKEPPTSLALNTNTFINDNIVIGSDFQVDKTKIKPAAPASGFPSSTGNLKVANDLFLNGTLYARVEDQGQSIWLALKDYVQQFVPEIIVSTKILPVTGKQAPDPSKDGVDVSHTSKLKNVSNAECFTSIKRIKWKQVSDIKGYSNVVAGMNGAVPELSVYSSKISGAAGATTWSWKLTWEVTPTDRTAPNNPKLPLEEIEVLYFVIFYP